MRVLVVSLLLLASCVVDTTLGDSQLACAPSGDCPDASECVQGCCVPSGGAATCGARGDGGRVDGGSSGADGGAASIDGGPRDAGPPGAPVLLRTEPPSPSNRERSPVVIGTGPAGTQVRLFVGATCGEPAGAVATVDDGGAFRAALLLPANARTSISARVASDGGASSACSPSLDYLHDDTPPSTPNGVQVPHSLGTRATLQWNAATDNLAAPGALVYEACMRTDGGVGCASGVSRILRTAPGGLNVTAVDLEPGRSYQVWIRAIDPAGNPSPESAPTTVVGAVAYAQRIAAGQDHTCARRHDGGVRCWGRNSEGQLGTGNMTPSLTPVAVAVPSTQGVVAGGASSCVVVDTGAQCWGGNGNGRLGLVATNALSPQFADFGVVRTMTLGLLRSCAVSAVDGAVRCRGGGHLGDGLEVTSSRDAVSVQGLGAQAASVSATASHSCVLLVDGRVQCWGLNLFGQVGDDSVATRPLPTYVSNLNDAVDVATGSAHSCAVRRGGAVVCWGDNSAGQVSPSAPILVRTPTQVAGVAATQVVAADQHTCALSSGSVVCWGDNLDGQLGAGDFSPRTTVITVRKPDGTRLDNVVGLSALSRHTCAAFVDGSVRCWGAGSFGQLGDGQAVKRAAATPVIGLD